MRVLAPDLIRIIENSILTFHLFLKRDKKKSSGVINLFGNQNQLATPLQQVQSTLDKVKSDPLPCDASLQFYRTKKSSILHYFLVNAESVET